MSLDLAPGAHLGHYEIDKQLGRGGMGAVYRATHVGTGRSVALKVITPKLAAAADAVERFRREARALGRLQHPNVVDVSDFGVDKTAGGGELLYLVMELVKGGSLRDELKTHQRLALPLVVVIIEQVARALDAAHEAGIVHRDLKPENVQLVRLSASQVHVKVLDFGIAKLAGRDDVLSATVTAPTPTAGVDDPSGVATASEVLTGRAVIGTPPYMAPEQFFAQPIDARCDVYALAVMTWELLCGAVPRSGNMLAICAQHVTKAPLPRMIAPNVPRAVKALVVSALALDPAERPATAGAFASRLRSLAAGEAALYEAASVSVPRRVWMRTVFYVALGAPVFFALAAWSVSATTPGLGRVLEGQPVSPSWALLPVAILLAGQWLCGGAAAVGCAERRRPLDVLAGPAIATIRASGIPVRDVSSLLAPLIVRSISAVAMSVLVISVAFAALTVMFDLSALYDETIEPLWESVLIIGALLAGPVAAVGAAVFITARQIAAAQLIVDSHRGTAAALPLGRQLGGLWRRAMPLTVALIAVLAFGLMRGPMLRAAVSVPLSLSIVWLVGTGADATPDGAFDPLGRAIDRGALLLGPVIGRRRGIDESPMLARAVAVGNAEALGLLLAANIASVDVRNGHGHTALSLTADELDEENRRAMARQLLDAGADPDVENADGSTARARLLATGDLRLAALLERRRSR